MNSSRSEGWAYAESFHTDDEVFDAARALADELGVTPVSPGAAGILRMLGAASRVRSAVEIGTGTGVSGLALLRGMPADGVLTTIDVESRRQSAARQIFAAAGVSSHRVRVINGRAQQVLARLAEGSYDLVFVDADPLGWSEIIPQAMRLLKSGGVFAVHQVLQRGAVAEPSNREPKTQAVRKALRELKEQRGLFSTLVPAGDGLLIGVLD